MRIAVEIAVGIAVGIAVEIAGGIDGGIVTLATLAALSQDGRLGARRLLLGTVGTMVVLWIAHSYVEILSHRALAARILPWAERRPLLIEEWSIVRAVVPAALALALGAIDLRSRGTAVTTAPALGVGELVGWGLLIAHRAGLSWWKSIPAAFLDAGLGVVIVVLKVLLGH